MVNLPSVVSALPDGDTAIQIEPNDRLIGGPDSILLRLPRADASKGMVGAYQLRVKANPPIGCRPCPQAKQAGVFMDGGRTRVKRRIGGQNTGPVGLVVGHRAEYGVAAVVHVKGCERRPAVLLVRKKH